MDFPGAIVLAANVTKEMRNFVEQSISRRTGSGSIERSIVTIEGAASLGAVIVTKGGSDQPLTFEWVDQIQTIPFHFSKPKA